MLKYDRKTVGCTALT